MDGYELESDNHTCTGDGCVYAYVYMYIRMINLATYVYCITGQMLKHVE